MSLRRALPGLVALVPACSLFTDLSGFSTSASNDAPDAKDGATAEASVTPGEGGSDGGPDALPAFGCASKIAPSFCQDFDGTEPLGTSSTGWSHVDPSLTLDTAFSMSPPRGARISVASGGCSFVTIDKTFAGTFSSGRIEAALRPQSSSSVLVISFNVTDTLQYNLVAFVEPNTISVIAQRFDGAVTDLGGQDATFSTPLFGVWNPIELSFTSSPRRASFRVASVEAHVDLPAEWQFKKPNFVVGAWCAEAPTEMTVDDVAIWVTP